MKKLLALILCVMLFVSVIPTMAFAEDAYKPVYTKYPWVDNPLMSLAQYKSEIENMMKNTKEDIQNAYAELASTKSVYSTAKGMDDTIVGLVDALANSVMDKKIAVQKNDGTGVEVFEYKFTKTDADNVKDQIRLIVDKKVAESMKENEFKYVEKYDENGKIIEINPMKYAQTFGKAVSDALTNKDFQKGYEAVATYFALASLVKDINDNLKDEYKAFYGEIGTKFDADFTAKYPELVKNMNYIDTITENLGDKAFWAWDGVTEYPFAPDNGWDARDN